MPAPHRNIPHRNIRAGFLLVYIFFISILLLSSCAKQQAIRNASEIPPSPGSESPQLPQSQDSLPSPVSPAQETTPPNAPDYTEKYLNEIDGLFNNKLMRFKIKYNIDSTTPQGNFKSRKTQVFSPNKYKEEIINIEGGKELYSALYNFKDKVYFCFEDGQSKKCLERSLSENNPDQLEVPLNFSGEEDNNTILKVEKEDSRTIAGELTSCYKFTTTSKDDSFSETSHICYNQNGIIFFEDTETTIDGEKSAIKMEATYFSKDFDDSEYSLPGEIVT